MWSVKWTAHCLFVLFGTCLLCESSKTTRQERALIKYSNPAYITNVTVFTGRSRRNDPYMTNLTGTILMDYNNNVSASIAFHVKNGDDFKLSYPLCESFKVKWVRIFLKQYTDVPISCCPLTAGTYHFINMELPPKNLPVPIPDGDYHFLLSLFLTDNPKEVIILASVFLRYENNKRRG